MGLLDIEKAQNLEGRRIRKGLQILSVRWILKGEQELEKKGTT